jgi:drug/metabolite transporter (DMT)-like permease
MKWFNTTSKKLTWVAFILYSIQVGFSAYAQVTKGVDISNLLVYTTPLIVTIFGAYFTKSGFENLTTIKQSNNSEGEI